MEFIVNRGKKTMSNVLICMQLIIGTYWVNKALIPRRHKKSVQTIPPKNSKLKDIKTIHSKYSAIVKY